jgi:hypothetical protein
MSGGLPSYFRLVPTGFYVALVLALALNIYFSLSLRVYKASEEIWQGRAQQAKSSQTQLISKQATITKESEHAKKLAQWLEGARPVQPIGVSISRSMGKDSTIAELDLQRNPQIPAHLFLTLKVNGSGGQQVSRILDALNSLSYQTYSAQQVKGPTAVDFQATLIYHQPE